MHNFSPLHLKVVHFFRLSLSWTENLNSFFSHFRCQSFLQASYIKSEEFSFSPHSFYPSTQSEKSSFNFTSNIIHEEAKQKRHRYFTICWCTSKSFHPLSPFETIFYTKSNRIRVKVDFVDTSYQILSVCGTVIDVESDSFFNSLTLILFRFNERQFRFFKCRRLELSAIRFAVSLALITQQIFSLSISLPKSTHS